MLLLESQDVVVTAGTSHQTYYIFESVADSFAPSLQADKTACRSPFGLSMWMEKKRKKKKTLADSQASQCCHRQGGLGAGCASSV